jgi:hypothetical protein
MRSIVPPQDWEKFFAAMQAVLHEFGSPFPNGYYDEAIELEWAFNVLWDWLIANTVPVYGLGTDLEGGDCVKQPHD